MEPALGFFKTLRPAELSRDQQGDVEKYFPVVDVRGYFIKVDFNLCDGVRPVGVKLSNRIEGIVNSRSDVERDGRNRLRQLNRLNQIAPCNGGFEIDHSSGRKGDDTIFGLVVASPKQQ